MFLNENELEVLESRIEFIDILSQLMHFKSNIPELTKVYEDKKQNFIESINKHSNKTRAQIIKEAELAQTNRRINGLPLLIYQMTLIHAVTYFDVFLSKITTLLLKSFWQSLKTKTKNLTYEELLSFDSIEDIKNNLIKKEVEVLGRQSIKERIEYLEKKFNLNFKYVSVNEKNGLFFNEIVEIYSARNLIIHNNSIVNETYLKLNSASNYKLGENLKIDASYLTNSLHRLLKACHEITNVSVKKINENYKDN